MTKAELIAVITKKTSNIPPLRADIIADGGIIFAIETGGHYWRNIASTIACGEQHLWDNFCRAIGREDLTKKKDAMGDEKDRLVAELSEIFATKTRYQWFDFFKDKNVCAAPVNNVDEALKDPQVLHRQMILEFNHPTVGKIRQLGIPIKLSKALGSVRSLGVPLGAHTEEVLAELGYSRAEMEELRG